MILGITGGVGCGKSTVLQYLRDHYGAVLIECDEVARQLQQPGGPCYEPMLRLFQEAAESRKKCPDRKKCAGEEGCLFFLNEDGSFNRGALAQLVFGDEKLLSALNAIVHPEVKKHVKERILSCRRSPASGETQGGDPLIVIEAALLLEDHYDEICDEIWYVYAGEDVRRERLISGRGYSDEKIDRIFANQRSEESFRACCALTIDNSSENIENTFRQIDEALAARGIRPLAGGRG